MILELIIFLLLTCLVNQFSFTSKVKIVLNIIGCFLICYFFGESYLEKLENIFFFLTYYFIVMNIYTTRYSSIRFMILDKILRKEKIPSENWLYLNRKKRLRKNSSFMSKELFVIIYFPIVIFKKLFKI